MSDGYKPEAVAPVIETPVEVAPVVEEVKVEEVVEAPKKIIKTKKTK